MKKPIIKNWIKYWSTTIAVSGMLAMGACDNNSSDTANNTADNIETTTEEAATSTRDNVNQGLEDMENEAEQLTATETAEEQEAETESAVNQPQYEQTSNRPASSAPSASSIPNMDAHLEEHKEENEAIKEELTDASLSESANMGSTQGTQSSSMNQQETSGYQSENPGTTMDNPVSNNPTQQQNSLDTQTEDSINNPQGAQGIQQENQGMTSPGTSNDQLQETSQNLSNSQMGQESDPNTPAAIYERHIAVYPEGLSDYAQQQYNNVMEDYQERRESMRGQMNEETGAYFASEVDPQPTVGFDELRNIIQRNVEFPRTAAAADVEGIAFVNLVIDEEGNIEEAKAIDEFIEASSDYPQSFTEEDIESAKEDLKREAERAVKETSGLWEAAEQNGEKVKSEIQIPVRFITKEMGVGEHEDLGTGVGEPTDVKTPIE